MNTTTITVIVVRKWQEAFGICGFEFRSPDGAPLLVFTAGAHIDVRLPGGLVRQYSLCGDPALSDRYEIAVLRDEQGRGGSMAFHDQIREGDLVQIGAPRNHFPLCPQAARHLLLAGGIGVTPILAMAQSLCTIGASFDMHYCARSRERAAFAQRLDNAAFRDHIWFHFDDESADHAFDLESILGDASAGTHLYVCGPQGFMEAVLAAARMRGWAEARLHYECFSGTVAKQRAETAFQVQIASSGVLIDVEPGCSVVEALSRHGVEVVTSCQQGLCGTCMTRVLEGLPDHRDSYLTDEEKAGGQYFLPCCSRSESPVLVLDL